MDFTHEALKMAGALALVVVVLLVGLAWVRRLFGEIPGQEGQAVLQILGGLRLGTGKQIMLIEVAGEILVLGTTPREMTLLTKISDDQRVHQVRSIAPVGVGGMNSWLGQWKTQVLGKARVQPTSPFTVSNPPCSKTC